MNLENHVFYTTEDTGATPPAEEKVKSTEVLRTLSKQFGVNLFEPDGVKALTDKLAKEQGEITTLKTNHDTLFKTVEEYKVKEQDYELKFEALSLGFQAGDLQDVLVLAKNYAKDGNIKEGLKKVQEKYAKAFSTQIGKVKEINDTEKLTEAERYMRKNPKYNKK